MDRSSTVRPDEMKRERRMTASVWLAAVAVGLAIGAPARGAPEAQKPPAAATTTPAAGAAGAQGGQSAQGHAVITGRVLGAGGAVPKHAVVYLTDVPQSAWSPPKERATISQRGAQFRPDFLVVSVGQTVDMPNDDRIAHNVFSLSPAKKFDLGHYPQGELRSVRFDKPGVVELFCNIHENMQAVIVVAPSTFFAVVGADGRFELAGVPAGRYGLAAYSPELGQATSPIELKAGGRATIELALKAL